MTTGPEKGGIARAEALTPERRTEIARMGAAARAGARTSGDLPGVTHRGKIEISEDFALDCFVLEDGTRVISENAIARQLGRGLGGKSLRLAERDNRAPLPAYFTKVLELFVPDSLRIALTEPVMFRDRGGARRGVNAMLITEICEVWRKADDAGKLQASQKSIAKKADLLIRALATVGAVALVDEVTGYQEVRDRTELRRILAAYINEDLLPWTMHFPPDFYEEMFRLRGWTFTGNSGRGPRYAGKLTNEIVYEKLPPGVLTQLREKNPAKDGQRARKHHQFLTEAIGHPHLDKQVAQVTALMRVSSTWPGFMKLFSRAFPPKHQPKQLPGFEDADEE